ncbi:unnamed protein product, partial [Adineta steineri]
TVNSAQLFTNESQYTFFYRTTTNISVTIEQNIFYIGNLQQPIARQTEVMFHSLLFTIVVLEVFESIGITVDDLAKVGVSINSDGISVTISVAKLIQLGASVDNLIKLGVSVANLLSVSVTLNNLVNHLGGVNGVLQLVSGTTGTALNLLTGPTAPALQLVNVNGVLQLVNTATNGILQVVNVNGVDQIVDSATGHVLQLVNVNGVVQLVDSTTGTVLQVLNGILGGLLNTIVG